jgi:hypothetical protein
LAHMGARRRDVAALSQSHARQFESKTPQRLQVIEAWLRYARQAVACIASGMRSEDQFGLHDLPLAVRPSHPTRGIAREAFSEAGPKSGSDCIPVAAVRSDSASDRAAFAALREILGEWQSGRSSRIARAGPRIH